MAYFYGTLKGKRPLPLTDRGTKNSGLEIYAANWTGAIHLTLYYDEKTKADRFKVEQVKWQGQGVNEVIAEGELGKPLHRGFLREIADAVTEKP